MKALVFNGPWDMVLEDRDIRPPGRADVVVEVIATGICGSDIHGYTGHTGRRHAGQVMGHETVGRIVEIGTDVSLAMLDALVSVNPVLGCGICSSCRGGQQQVCETLEVMGVAPHIDAAFADYVTAPASNVVRLPTGMIDRHGALVEPLAVGYHAGQRGDIGPDDRVVVIGGGPIGQAAALAARRLGAPAVLVSEPDPGRRAALAGMQMATCHPDDLGDAIPTTIGGPPSVVLDAVGVDATMADALAVSDRRARIVLVGMATPELTMSSYRLSVGERSVIGSFCYSAAEFRETVDWASDNSAIVESLIDFSGSLAEGPQLFHDLASGAVHANKVLLQPCLSGSTT